MGACFFQAQNKKWWPDDALYPSEWGAKGGCERAVALMDSFHQGIFHHDKTGKRQDNSFYFA